MEKGQKINCSVNSCKYNNDRTQECILRNILVAPVENCDTGNPDESKCSSYENGKIIK